MSESNAVPGGRPNTRARRFAAAAISTDIDAQLEYAYMLAVADWVEAFALTVTVAL